MSIVILRFKIDGFHNMMIMVWLGDIVANEMDYGGGGFPDQRNSFILIGSKRTINTNHYLLNF
jgi:hypothetical protein